jgi:hypothetical protein
VDWSCRPFSYPPICLYPRLTLNPKSKNPNSKPETLNPIGTPKSYSANLGRQHSEVFDADSGE